MVRFRLDVVGRTWKSGFQRTYAQAGSDPDPIARLPEAWYFSLKERMQQSAASIP